MGFLRRGDGAPARWRDRLLLAHACLCLLAVTWPVYPAAARAVGPLLWGLPFALVWNTGWIVATFFALIAYHRAAQRERLAEPGTASS